MFSWFTHEDVVLDKSVTDAPALSLSIEQAGGVGALRLRRSGAGRGRAFHSTGPAGAAVGALSKLLCLACVSVRFSFSPTQPRFVMASRRVPAAAAATAAAGARRRCARRTDPHAARNPRRPQARLHGKTFVLRTKGFGRLPGNPR